MHQTPTSSRKLPRGWAIAAGAIALLTFSGCAPQETLSTPTPALPTASSTVLENHDNRDSPHEKHAQCDSVLSLEALYTYNPNFAPQPDYRPEAGTVFATIESLGGTSCAWINETSGATIHLGIVHVSSNEREKQKQNVASWQHTRDETIDIYFERNDTAGEAQAFSENTWMAVQSTEFFSEGDVEPLIAAAREALIAH